MIDSGDIERKMEKDNLYPVYAVLDKSKILAEFNGIQFGEMFQYGMSKRRKALLEEFVSVKKKDGVGALLQYFGFFVVGSLLASRMYDDKDTRSSWLQPVLDLEKARSISIYFDNLVPEAKLLYITKELLKKYPKSVDVLDEAIKSATKMKDLVDSKGKGLEKMFKIYTNEWENQ